MPNGGGDAEAAVESKGIEVCLNAETRRRSSGDGKVRARRAEGRPRIRGRHRGDGGRHRVPMRRSRAGRGLAVNRGIVVDDRLADRRSPASTPSANAPSIAAAATAWSSRPTSRRRCWPTTLAGGTRSTTAACSSTNLKVTGVNVFSAGDFIGGEPAPSRSCSRDRGRRHLQEARHCATSVWSARCCSAIPQTRSGIST